jgi:hypothetical protein
VILGMYDCPGARFAPGRFLSSMVYLKFRGGKGG